MDNGWNEFSLGNRPPNGVVVIVEGVVRYGRKRQVMAAKIMEVFGDNFQSTFEWVALKNVSAYSEVVRLKTVFKWKSLA